MLAYLDSLCAALLSRDSREIRRLLALPAASQLPRAVREEALAISQSRSSGLRAPVQALHYYYKLSHLVNENVDEGFRLYDDEIVSRSAQIELPLRAASGA
jgi:hypothetical protein